MRVPGGVGQGGGGAAADVGGEGLATGEGVEQRGLAAGHGAHGGDLQPPRLPFGGEFVAEAAETGRIRRIGLLQNGLHGLQVPRHFLFALGRGHLGRPGLRLPFGPGAFAGSAREPPADPEQQPGERGEEAAGEDEIDGPGPRVQLRDRVISARDVHRQHDHREVEHRERGGGAEQEPGWVSWHGLANGGLIRAQKRLHIFPLSANDHSRKTFVPYPRRHIGLAVEPLGKQAQLAGIHLPFFNARQQVSEQG
ncbi:MAG: hypothetical protein U1F77_00415 [Kiritimatiellia bacterium]